MMICSWKEYKVKLGTSFVLSYGSFDERTAYLVTLTEGENSGVGEATAISYYGWSEEYLEKELKRCTNHINEGRPISILFDDEELAAPVRNAIQCAWVDLQARKQNITIRAYYRLPPTSSIRLSSITISGSTRVDLETQIAQYDWPIYKIKMGSTDDEMKLDVIKSHPDHMFRIDANAGWSLEWTMKNKEALSIPNIEFVEQPFAIKDWDKVPQLKSIIDKPIYADESFQTIDDLKKCATYFDGINVKLMKCGGLDRALDIIRQAKGLGLKIMVGCMTETSIGISHAIQLLPLIDIADVDGSHLIKNDPAKGSHLDKGVIHESTGIGCGAQIIT